MITRIGNRNLFTAPLVLAMVACAGHPSQRPATDLPEHFSALSEAETASPPDQNWYRQFSSAELTALIQAAEQANLDVTAASARVLQANARARAAGAPLLPEFDLNGNVIGYSGHTGSASAHETDWAALLSASYEIDFWGKNRATARSTQLQATASIADRATVALTTRASVANSYFQLLSVRERLRLAESDVKARQQVLRLLEARYRAGQTDGIELAMQRATVANAQRTIPQLRQQETELLGALAELVGRRPEGFVVAGQSLDPLTVPAPGAGLPSQLLMRRPDLQTAESNLLAADADVAVARAALFPTLTLTVNGGLQNPAMQAALLTLAGAGTSLTIGATLLQSIFDNGRRRAQTDLVAARETELVAVYRGAVLAALVDVENALAARASLDEQQPMVAAALEQSQRALDGDLVRYQAGSGDYLTLLEAERTFYAAQDQLSQYKMQRLQAAVGLCRALGGGWQPADTPPMAAEPPAPAHATQP